MPRKPTPEDIYQSTGLDPRRTWNTEENATVFIRCAVCKAKVPLSDSRQFFDEEQRTIRTCELGRTFHKASDRKKVKA